MQSTAPSDNCVLDEIELGLSALTSSSVVECVMPVDTGALSSSERSKLRYRRALVTGGTSILAKMTVLASTLISVPLTFHYLGADRYGLWMTITSFVLFLGFADFGVGNGLAMAISAADGRADHGEAHRQTSCAFFLLLGLAGGILLLLASGYAFVPWSHLYGTRTSLAAQEAGPATAILIFCTALSMPLGTVLRVQIGYQQGYLGDLWNALGNALALAGIVYVTRVGGGLTLLVLAVAGAPVLVTGLNWLVQFFVVRPGLRPRLDLFDRRGAYLLATTGALFFAQQCFGLMYYVSDNIIIARTMGTTAVAGFAVLQRIFSIGLVAQYFMVPLWPALGEALARGDRAWARGLVRRAIAASLVLGAVCGVSLLLASRYLVKRWSGADIGSPDLLRVGFAVWVVLVGYIAAMNAVLNQPAVMVQHLKIFGAASIASLIAKILFARHGSLAGVVWSTILGFGILYVIPATRLALRSVSPAREVDHATV